MNEQTVSMNLSLPASLHRELKIEAAKCGTTLKRLVAERLAANVRHSEPQ
jgi:predicted HicB family RNase H-like nuclease